METQYSPQGVVVVGGGLAGLATSAYLARAGVPVQVFEKGIWGPYGAKSPSETLERYAARRS